MKRFDEEGALPKSFSKRIVETWNIHDITSMETEKEAIQFWNEHSDNPWWLKRFPTVDVYLEFWRKTYKRK